MHTVQQMNPTVKYFESLCTNGVTLGCQIRSFVGEYLRREFSIAEENLKTYSTLGEVGEILRKAPKKGGVAAIFDEIPYMRIFLASQCGYTTVGPIYRIGGFIFVSFFRSSIICPNSNAFCFFHD